MILINLVIAYLAGIDILFTAVILNVIAGKMGLSTWYDFILNIGRENFKDAVMKLGFCSIVFMAIVYPLLLGVTAVLSYRILTAYLT